jgi:hypothetical protein
MRQGRGLGKLLYSRLIQEAITPGFRQVIAVIALECVRIVERDAAVVHEGDGVFPRRHPSFNDAVMNVERLLQ